MEITHYLLHNKQEVFLLMFMVIYKKETEAEDTVAMTTVNEREITARCHRTQIVVERKT